MGRLRGLRWHQGVKEMNDKEAQLMHPMLGQIRPDPWGEALGTGFWQFRSPCGLNGLARVIDGALHLLAVDACNPGRGQFRSFITTAKLNYPIIYVWEIWNPWLEAVLARYGFTPAQMTLEGDLLKGVVWRNPSLKPSPSGSTGTS